MLLLANGGLTYNSTQAFTRVDSGLGSSRFTRRYWGNRCCFLFHRLVIFLSSAGRSCIAEVGKRIRDVYGPKLETYETIGLQGRSPILKPS